jgi:hypothetical protein
MMFYEQQRQFWKNTQFWYSAEKERAEREHDIIELHTATATKYAHSRMQNKL